MSAVLFSVLRGCTPLFLCALWTCWNLHCTVWQTIESHSGYVVPFPLSPWSLPSALGGEQGRHEFHHSRNVGNFGGFFNWWDRLCGTDAEYEAWRAAGSPPLKEIVNTVGKPSNKQS